MLGSLVGIVLSDPSNVQFRGHLEGKAKLASKKFGTPNRSGPVFGANSSYTTS